MRKTIDSVMYEFLTEIVSVLQIILVATGTSALITLDVYFFRVEELNYIRRVL